MKNFKENFKSVTIVMLVLLLFASIGMNYYQKSKADEYEVKFNQLYEFSNEFNDMVCSACEEASENMSVSDRLMIERVFERTFNDETLAEMDKKYYALQDVE